VAQRDLDHDMNGAAMQWFGKAIGGVLGLVVAGPIGSVVGVLVGHQFDQGIAQRLRGRAGSLQQISQLFFEVAFEVMGNVAKVDGRVSEDEIRVARGIMHGMRLSPDQMREAIDRFTHGKSAGYPLERRLGALAGHVGGRNELARAFVQIQLQAAVGAGEIDIAKRQLLWRIANALHVNRAEVAQLEAAVRAYQQRGARAAAAATNLDDAYRVLGVAPGASDEDVKKAYRRLMNQHHPDKLVSRGLPESMVGVAEQKTREVRAAYETIKERRAAPR
jgi:DnaJ like chaperone protein